jgi:hypothetical protein
MSSNNWPSHTDYQDSIQNPQICFEEPVLKTAEVTCDMLGLPKVMSGNFASVYSVTTGADRWAIRCFVRQVLGQQGRYARLCQHLCGLGLPCMVTFDYFLRGIKVRNEWYPIVRMQWVEGLPMNNWVEDNSNNPAALRDLAAKLRVLMRSLREHLLAHGDLQHGNVMITPQNELRLVDYDGMYTPAFKGKSPEMGHANFQHPRRTPDFYNEDLDNFAALVIYTSLLGTAADEGLFKKFYSGDNILLVSKDYQNPGQSAAIQALKACADPNVSKLATLIERLCRLDISKVPLFEDVGKAVDEGKLDEMINTLPDPAAAPVAASGGVDWLSDAEPQITPTGTRISPPTTAAPRPSTPTPTPRPPATPGAPRPGTPAAPKPAGSGALPKPAAPAIPRPAQPSSIPRPAAQPSRSTTAKPSAPASAPAQMPVPAGGGEGMPTWKLLAIIGGLGIAVLILMYFVGKK